MSKNLIFEIGTEELPVSAQSIIRKKSENIAAELFKEYNIGAGSIKVFVTPCRVILYVQKTAEKEITQIKEIMGPPKNIAYDDKGAPAKALLGFVNNNKIPLEKIKIKQTPKGEYIAIELENKPRQTKDLLPVIYQKFIEQIPFAKYMVWNSSSVRFSRPIRWFLCMFGREFIKFEFAQIKSAKHTYSIGGYKSKRLDIKDPSGYFSLLKRNQVIVDYEERKQAVILEVKKVCRNKVTPVIDDELTDESAGLVEYPVAVLSKFDPSFLELPGVVVKTVLKHHQKCFSAEDDKGSLAPFFIGIKNGTSSSIQIVREGYERVVSARLNDAQFFYNQDKKIKFQDNVTLLKKVIYQEKLGSVYDKQTRISTIALGLADILSLDEQDREIEGKINRASLLCKADLVTEMVKEFPELQGIMGSIYAGLTADKDISESIKEHYLPKFSGDSLPVSVLGSVISIADKLDNIASSFVLGHRPKGSYDPYGLRRQMAGIIEICMDKTWDFDLYYVVGIARLCFQPGFQTEHLDNTTKDLRDFIKKRLENWLIDKGYKFDEVRAVVYTGTTCRIHQAIIKTNVISDFREHKEFAKLIALYKRANNIVKQAHTRGILPKGFEIKNDLLVMDEEQKLAEHVKLLEDNLSLNLNKEESYKNFMVNFALVKPRLDAFFDKVLVMDINENIRNNRLRLLHKMIFLAEHVADFSKIVLLEGL
ncbi:glycine--tRNA ligase subunit beta [bacterium]